MALNLSSTISLCILLWPKEKSKSKEVKGFVIIKSINSGTRLIAGIASQYNPMELQNVTEC